MKTGRQSLEVCAGPSTYETVGVIGNALAFQAGDLGSSPSGLSNSQHADVAQMDRAPDFYSGGCGFEPYGRRHYMPAGSR